MGRTARGVQHCVLLFLLLGGQPASAESVATPVSASILALCGTCQVLLLGETHQQPDSPPLFLAVVQRLLAQRARLLVGLEITTRQQAALDAVLDGTHSPAGIAPAMIDSPAYQAMLLALSQLHQAQRGRLTVAALDDLKTDTPRDAALAAHLQGHLATGQYDRAVVLVGNLHAVRRMHWAEDAGQQAPYLAERLVTAGFRVTSVMQDGDAACQHQRQPTVYSPDAPRELDAVQRRLQAVKHHAEMDMRRAVDGVVVWECRQ